MTKEEFRLLLDKKLQGQCTEEELRLIESVSEHFLQQNQEAVFSSEEEKQAVYHDLRKRVRLPRSYRIPVFRIAASLLILLGIGFLIRYAVNIPELNTLATSTGEQREITLSDGTRVKLGAESILKYPKAFDGSSRRVELTGQAYFEVTHNPDKPFTVSSGGVETRVLGTSFDVNAYPEDSLIAISLVEGSVRVRKKDHTAMLKPGQQARFKPGVPEPELGEFEAEHILAWTFDQLDFQRSSFEQVARILKRQYGITIGFDDPQIAGYTISGRFKDADPETVLRAITRARQLEYRKTGEDTYLIIQPAQ